ncbi:fibronectin type III domain-containing protein 7-like isoform X2 [Phyllopteryx taeniolatus]|uniref:fibronectin type III domain-containing protein 7-like isoform X2 n=1 Tax=Phyllopteryx taeniolatus TaxID=161469 RepID=UPI002AD44CF0|nr:fibronectin type III domain-containing protein 7-like isoform X2 [Phyllopteryx taeniolatus]
MGALKGLVTSTLVLLCICTEASAQTAFTASVFTKTSRSATLQWNRYDGASSYLITVSLEGTQDIIAFTQFGENTVMGTLNSLSPNTLYVFTVQPLDINQIPQDMTTVQLLTAPELMAPIQKVKPKDSQTLIVEFNLVTGATHYIVRVQSSDRSYREERVYSSPAEINSLIPYTEYTLSIMAGNSGGRNQPSPSVTGKTVLPPLQLSASSPSNDSIVISWDPIDSAVQYTVVMYEVFSNTTIKQNTSSTSVTFSGLDAGSLFMIMGYGWDAEERKGEGSLYINQTTRPPMPASVDVSVVMSADQAVLSVSCESNQEAYGNIEYYVMSDQNLTCNTTSSPCLLSPVGCGEVHIIQVIASNDAGPGYPSSPVEFITFPCTPESLALVESMEGNCTLSWDTEPYADSYMAYIKKGDGSEETCNTTNNNCTYHCQCGYMFHMYVFAYNHAGSSPQGPVVNYTSLPCCPEDVSVSLVSTETLEITWAASRGADLYETRVADISEVVLCNDTAPVCALSDLSCDSAYSVVVTPCNDMSGCNFACNAHTKDTAPCMPMYIQLDPKNSSCVSVSWRASNRAANYSVSAMGEDGTHTCISSGSSCELTDLPCGSIYEVTIIATSVAGQSLPSYSETLETEPCCPASPTVHQVTQAMTNVSWSHAKGAYSFISSLTSPHGHASCHTQDLHCLMGCITCGTNYTVTMEAFSHSGRSANCTYQGFSSSACCPSGVRVYKMAGNSLRLLWRTAGSDHRYVAEMMGSSNYYNCTTSAGESSCNIENVQCGDIYLVVVAPLTPENSKVSFCAQRVYSVTCSGSDVGTVNYRGKRSVDDSMLAVI